MGFRVQGLGFRVEDEGFRVEPSVALSVQGFAFGDSSAGVGLVLALQG